MSKGNNVMDNMLIHFLEKHIVDRDFVEKYHPHIIMFGDYSFLDVIFKDGKWVVFTHLNCKSEFSKLFRKFYLDTPSYKVEGLTSIFNPVSEKLYYVGVSSIWNKNKLKMSFDSLYQLYSFYRLDWMCDYRNIRCFRVNSDQSVTQVSLSKIAVLEGINEDSFSFKEEYFDMYTPTLSDDEYKKYYEYNP